ncbi:Ig-like domain-containing protein [Pedobacter sp. KR3-3]|uniref:Ig-like domain-containing protein n=1 Tax=Pedobacter albus TaxID=3113905 RepID=A0ABU7ICW2_9SPHI|nr:Ig-like domain-containing protein [Pedobacter sp. KR3-3]MEE1947333.1 Ig-like domain-containing protein [Pedobacter sp. KR3-3]
MPKNAKYSKNQILYLGVFLTSLILGCATMRTPEGGPRDKTPPKVLKMEPKNLTTNFNAKKIVIEFDEYIKLNNEFKEFSISPEQEKPPVLKAKLKHLEITLQDSLEKNTTYTLNFGKAITDVNEGNILKNFTYVLSTGPTLDSLSISGKVRNSLTGAPEIDATVFIFPLERDSLFGKKKPSIFTTTDSSGNYKLNNLKKGSYKIYALKEKSGDRIYQQLNDEIGFIKTPLVLDKSNLDSVNLQIFKELAVNFRVLDKKLNNDGSISMVFNQQLKKPQLTVTEPANIDLNKKVQFNKTNDSVKVWLTDMGFDSVKIAIKDEGKLLETERFTRGKRDTYTRNIQATDNLESNSLNPYKPFQLHFNLPIENIDMSKVTLLEDSIPRKGFTLTKDSTNILSYNVAYKWQKKEEYILVLAEGAITGIFNTKNKEIRKTFKLGSSDDYGTLTLKVEVPDTAKNYILQLVNEKKDQVIYSESINKNKSVIFSKYRQGIYYARIVYDTNKNGIWDTGDVAKGLQPEKIWYGPKELSIRANFDRNEVLTIPKE